MHFETLLYHKEREDFFPLTTVVGIGRLLGSISWAPWNPDGVLGESGAGEEDLG